MEQKTTPTIFLMKNGQVLSKIIIKNIEYYKFTFDSNQLSTLTLISSNFKMRDLKLLSTRPYESYVVMAEKEITEDDKTYNFSVSAVIYKHMSLTDNNGMITLIFSEEVPSNEN